ncbi:MAG: RND transporter, partial [Gammaproteobacteria bacterium]|nr:RND transporter [Gammaproteobacteria bacterium]
MMHRFFHWVIKHPKTIYLATLLVVLALGAMIPNINIDTDPETMLPADNPARMFHNSVKHEFNLRDSIVVGVTNESHENGIYNVESLNAIHELTTKVLTIDGVISQDLMSLSAVDNITQEGPGTIRFEWLMAAPPKDAAGARAIQAAVGRLPMLENSLVSGDGKAAAIYIPIADKNQSYIIAEQIRAYFPATTNGDQYFLTGLPVAEDQFGYEMFVQMGISAPMAGVMIFLVMWLFFRNIPLISAAMLVAM